MFLAFCQEENLQKKKKQLWGGELAKSQISHAN